MRTDKPAQAIMHHRGSVERDARADEPSLLRRASALFREAPTAGRHKRLHPTLANAPNHPAPIIAEVRLPADEDHLHHSEVRDLIDEVEALGRRELVGPRMSGPRSAVPAS